MAKFVSEKIKPFGGWFETGGMARGEPGLPAGFVFRGREVRVVERLASGKQTGSDGGERYVRRHSFCLRMEDGSIWNVYCPRQPPFAWFLRSIVEP